MHRIAESQVVRGAVADGAEFHLVRRATDCHMIQNRTSGGGCFVPTTANPKLFAVAHIAMRRHFCSWLLPLKQGCNSYDDIKPLGHCVCPR